MLITPEFKMTEDTKLKFAAALDGLPEDRKAQILNAVSFLAAEIEVHSRTKVFEELRQEWGQTLATMFVIEPRKK